MPKSLQEFQELMASLPKNHIEKLAIADFQGQTDVLLPLADRLPAAVAMLGPHDSLECQKVYTGAQVLEFTGLSPERLEALENLTMCSYHPDLPLSERKFEADDVIDYLRQRGDMRKLPEPASLLVIAHKASDSRPYLISALED